MHEDHTIWQLSFAAVPGIFRIAWQDFPAMADRRCAGAFSAEAGYKRSQKRLPWRFPCIHL